MLSILSTADTRLDGFGSCVDDPLPTSPHVHILVDGQLSVAQRISQIPSLCFGKLGSQVDKELVDGAVLRPRCTWMADRERNHDFVNARPVGKEDRYPRCHTPDVGLVVVFCESLVFAQHHLLPYVGDSGVGRPGRMVVAGCDLIAFQKHHGNDVLQAMIAVGGVEQVARFIDDGQCGSLGPHVDSSYRVSCRVQSSLT